MPPNENSRESKTHSGATVTRLRNAGILELALVSGVSFILMANEPNHAPRPTPEAEEIYRRWIQFLDDEFTRHSSEERRAEIVRDQLYQLYLGRPHGGKLNLTLTSELPGNVVSLSLDPQNVTLEAGHFADVDRARFNARKPLLWFWQMFDRSPVGLNHWLGLRFRCMLGRHIFARMGNGVKIYHGVDLTYGYNLSIGNGVTIHQCALSSTIVAASPSATTPSSAPSRASSLIPTTPRTTKKFASSPPPSVQVRTSPRTRSCSAVSMSPTTKSSAASPTTVTEAQYSFARVGVGD